MSDLHVIALLGFHNHSRIDNAQTLLIAEKLAKGGKMYKKSITQSFSQGDKLHVCEEVVFFSRVNDDRVRGSNMHFQTYL